MVPAASRRRFPLLTSPPEPGLSGSAEKEFDTEKGCGATEDTALSDWGVEGLLIDAALLGLDE